MSGYLASAVGLIAVGWWAYRQTARAWDQSRTAAIRTLFRREAAALKAEEEATGVSRLRIVYSESDGRERLTEWQQRKARSDVKRRQA